MFTKLLKHEFKATGRQVPLIYLVTILMILTNILARQLGVAWLSGSLLVLLVLLGIAEVLMTYVVVFYRYYKNLYNSEGYLTHTLPVPPRQLLTSKLVVSFIWLFISYLIMFAVVLTVMLLMADDQGQSLRLVLDQLIRSTDLEMSSLYWIAGLILAYACLSIVFLMAQIFFAISMGNTSRFHHLGIAGPIVCYLGVYFASQIVVLGGLVLVPLGLTIENNALRLVSRSMLATFLNPDDVVIGLGSIMVIILAVIALFMGTAHLLKRHTSLR